LDRENKLTVVESETAAKEFEQIDLWQSKSRGGVSGRPPGIQGVKLARTLAGGVGPRFLRGKALRNISFAGTRPAFAGEPDGANRLRHFRGHAIVRVEAFVNGSGLLTSARRRP